MFKGFQMLLMACLSAVVLKFADEGKARTDIKDVDFTMFNEFADGIDSAVLGERSSDRNPKYFTTGIMAPPLSDVEMEVDGKLTKYRRTASVSITYLPEKGDTKALRTINKAEASLTPEQKKAKAQQWLAELEQE